MSKVRLETSLAVRGVEQAHKVPYKREGIHYTPTPAQRQPAAPSRKARGRTSKREARGFEGVDEKQQEDIVDLPTIRSQEASRRNHEEELQVGTNARIDVRAHTDLHKVS